MNAQDECTSPSSTPFAELERSALELLDSTSEVLADYEGLPNHASAAKARYAGRERTPSETLNTHQTSM